MNESSRIAIRDAINAIAKITIAVGVLVQEIERLDHECERLRKNNEGEAE